MLLSDADKLYLGQATADKVYCGSTQVWPVVSAPPFAPSDFSGLVIWLDASQLGLADGAAVSPWPNLGSAGNPTIVWSPAPVFRANALNGKGVVRFKYNEGRLRGSATLNWDYTVVYVVKQWGTNVGRAWSAVYPPNHLVGFHSSGYDWMYDGGSASSATAWPSPPSLVPWRMYGSSGHNANQTSRFFINGTPSGGYSGIRADSGAGTRYCLSGYSDATDASGNPETCDIDVAELVVYNRELTDADRITVENYLKTKWGL